MSSERGVDLKYNKPICTLPYIVTERTIENFEQKSRRIVRYIHLYSHKIESESHHFQIDQVFDISFKGTSGACGFLYLHTSQGVFMFLVEENPMEFIYAFKELRP